MHSGRPFVLLWQQTPPWFGTRSSEDPFEHGRSMFMQNLVVLNVIAQFGSFLVLTDSCYDGHPAGIR